MFDFFSEILAQSHKEKIMIVTSRLIQGRNNVTTNRAAASPRATVTLCIQRQEDSPQDPHSVTRLDPWLPFEIFSSTIAPQQSRGDCCNYCEVI